MCISPSTVWVERGPGFEKVQVPCKTCWSCRANRINGYVGRCLAEASVSDHVIKLELTYAPWDKRPWSAPGSMTGPYDMADKVITPSHAQDFLRALRNRLTNNSRNGGSLRYVICGEYGSDKGRAHFHCILFLRNIPDHLVPDYPEGQRHWIKQWPHGHIFAQHNPDYRGISYVMKYVFKDLRDGERQYWLSVSRFPTLGHEWFRALAERHVFNGTFPVSFEYRPPGSPPNKVYLLTGATKRDYILAIYRGHIDAGKVDLKRCSMWVRDAIERYEWREYVKALQPKRGQPLPDASSEADKFERLTERQANRKALEGLDWAFYWSDRDEEEKKPQR